jgi:hypothetical protein
MQRFVQGHDRTQASLLPASLEDYVDADNPARVIEAFVEALDLGRLGIAIVPAPDSSQLVSMLSREHPAIWDDSGHRHR